MYSMVVWRITCGRKQHWFATEADAELYHQLLIGDGYFPNPPKEMVILLTVQKMVEFLNQICAQY